MARNRRQKVKHYRRSYYSGRDKAKKAAGILVLLAIVLAAAWFAAPYVLDFATHTWYTYVRDRDLEAEAASRAASAASVSSEAAAPAASPSPTPTPAPTPAPDGTQVREGSWASVNLSALGDEQAVRAVASQLAGQGVAYALVPLKDTSGYIYYRSGVAAAAGSVAATVVDPQLIASVFKAQGITPVASLAAFQDPIAPYTDRSLGIRYGDYLWLDAVSAAAGGKAWLNPYSAGAVQFIGDLVAEVHGFGFDHVVLSNVQFPLSTSSKQSFGDTGGRSRARQLAADIAAWGERFAGEVALWYEYPLEDCQAVNATTQVMPAELGMQNLIVRLPADGAGQDVLDALAAQCAQQRVEHLVWRQAGEGWFA